MQISTHKRAVAVISGGMGYVGSAIATRLARDGMRVVILYHTSPVKSVNEFLASLGEGHSAYRCDLEDAVRVQKTIATIEQEQGAVHVYVHAAGAPPSRKSLHQSSAEDVLEAFKKNALCGFNFLVAGASYLKTRGKGVLIGITTVTVVSPQSISSLGAYVPAKYALQGMLASFQTELLPFGIRVYSVAPGFMEGGMNSIFPKAFVEMVKAESPTKTLSTADDVAKCVSFLASNAGEAETRLTIVIAPECGTT